MAKVLVELPDDVGVGGALCAVRLALGTLAMERTHADAAIGKDAQAVLRVFGVGE
jgi:hypothetical protein